MSTQQNSFDKRSWQYYCNVCLEKQQWDDLGHLSLMVLRREVEGSGPDTKQTEQLN